MGWSAEEHWPRDPGGVGQQRRFRRVMGLPVGGESGRRQPATRRAEAMAKFEALRDTGYRGPIDQDGHASQAADGCDPLPDLVTQWRIDIQPEDSGKPLDG